MDSMNHRTAEYLAAAAAAALAAALLFLGTGLHPIWWINWLAPLPVLWLAGHPRERAPGWMVALVAFAAWTAGGLNQWHYLRGTIGLPAGVVLGILALPALVLALAVLLWRGLLFRGRIAGAALALPCVWVSYEYAASVLSPHSTFGNMAYTQMDFLPILQLAALTGIWGLSFVLWLVPSGIAVLLAPSTTAKQRKTLGLALGASLAAVLVYGLVRLNGDLATTGTLNAALLSSTAREDRFPTDDARALLLARRYLQAFPEKGEALVLLPEKIARVSPAGAAAIRRQFAERAAASRADVVVGLDEPAGAERRNEALVFAKDGKLAVNYEKHHFIPGLEEGYAAGNDYAVLGRPSGLWGIAICKDLDFPAMGREYGTRGVGLLLVPAWDFDVDGWLHARMAILRGVESGFTVARAARQGLLTVSDYHGRLLLDLNPSEGDIAVSQVQVPVAHADTLYARYGDWFAWIAALGLAVLVVRRFSAEPRRGRARLA